jgi:Tol biopolymer transport system component
MQAERWKKVEELFEAARQQPADGRAGFLRQACPGDPELCAEVESLLKAAESGDPLLDGSPLSSIAERAPTLKPGDQLGSFEILGLIGRGGMGEVYRARDPRLKREVAIKTLPSTFAADRDRVARFEREARAASALNHPNIVSVHDIGHQGGVWFIVSELVEGETLARALKGGPLPLRKMIEVSTQIAEGLAAAHAAGVVHRDLKPGNIMLTRDGRVKILDFGLARRDRVPGADSTTMEVSHPGVILGTPGYMAPEQVRGEATDARSDLFSLGVILYEMASGRRAFSGGSSIEVMNSILKDEPPELPPASPPALDRIVRRCIDKQPSRRFQSAADLGFAVGSVGASPPIAAPVRKRASWRVWTAAAASAVLAVIAALYWARAHPASSPKAAAPVLRRLTNDAGLTKDGTISPDGKLAAYASDRANPGNLDIWVQQTDGGEPVRLTSDPADDLDPVFSADGSRVAFRSERVGGGIYEAPVIGGEARLLVPSGRHPRFSPDGQFLMYSTGLTSPGTIGTKLFVLALGGERPNPIAPRCATNPNAAWSPDSRQILFEANCPGTFEVNAIWTASPDGQNLRKTSVRNPFNQFDLDSPGGTISLNQWVPHPDRLLLPRLAGDVAYIASLPILADGMAANGPIERITYGVGSEERVSMSQNGRLVLTSSSRDSRVWGLSIDGNAKALGEPRELTGGLSDGLRGLSRDGRFLAYASGLSNPVLYLKDLTSGRQRAISPRAVAIGAARFNATGTQVLFRVFPPADIARLGGKAGPSRFYEAPTSGGVPEVMNVPVGRTLGFWDLIGHDKVLLGTWHPDGRAYFEIADVGGARRIHFLDDPTRSLWQGTVSKDGQWVTFNATSALNSQIYIVPYREAQIPVAEWIPVTDGSSWDDKPRFSSDGRMLFFISHRDGFFCIWAQRLEKDMHPAGKMFTVYHSHQVRRSIGNFPFGELDLEVGPGILMFDQIALTGNIWLLDPAGRTK